jgi:hypothetical protein
MHVRASAREAVREADRLARVAAKEIDRPLVRARRYRWNRPAEASGGMGRERRRARERKYKGWRRTNLDGEAREIAGGAGMGVDMTRWTREGAGPRARRSCFVRSCVRGRMLK